MFGKKFWYMLKKPVDDLKIDLDWIHTIESEKSLIRETDLYPMLRQWVDDSSPETILEIGCGQGACSNKFDLAKRHYTGLDSSSYLVNRAN